MSTAARTTSSTEHQSRRGSAAPAWSRERSSRLSTRRVRRALAVATTEASSARASSESVADSRPPRRRGDRRQRRAQVVRDRAQQRRLHDVAAAQGLGLDHLGLELSRRLAARTSVSSAGSTRSSSPPPLSGRNPAAPEPCPLGRPRPPAARPAALVAVRPPPPPPRRKEGRRPSPHAARAGSDSSMLVPPSSNRAISADRSASRLLLRLTRTRAAGVGERARDHRGDQEHPQRHPVLALCKMERVLGLEVEEVESRRAQEPGKQPKPQPPVARHQQHREQVHDTRGHRRGDETQRVVHARNRSHGRHRDRYAQQRRGPGESIHDRNGRVSRRAGREMRPGCDLERRARP